MKVAVAARIVARCALAAMMVLVAMADAFAAEVPVRGGGSAVYDGPSLDATTRQAALHAAKVDCVSDYVRRVVAANEHPLPVEYRDYFELAFHPELQGRLDEYLSDVTIDREWTDEADKRYTIIVRARLDEQRFIATLSWPKDEQ